MSTPPPSVPVVLALGSNQGDRMAALRGAVQALAPYVNIEKTSPVYETSAAYITDQPAFLNAVVMGTTSLSPITLLWNAKRIETELGRTPTFRFGPRLIDIDIIFYGNGVVESPELAVPHPRVAEREFVLRPLADIAPDWKHPKTGLTVEDMLKALPDTSPVNVGALVA